MLDRTAVTKRFLSCFPGKEAVELAELFDVTPPTVFQWFSGVRNAPWERIKDVADTKGISWDWFIEGCEPKISRRKLLKRSRPFDWQAINQRFLSLFPGISQKTLGKQLGVSQVSVWRWHNNKSNVPWEKLKYAVDHKSVSWEWLIEGENKTIVLETEDE